MRAILLFPSLAILLYLTTHAQADDAVSLFYDGRTVNVIVGTPPGGGYDTYARLTGRFLGRHIPGNPSVVVQYMPGAGGVKAANYTYTAAPRDGTTITTFNNHIPSQQLIGIPGVELKSEELSWIGALSSDSITYVAWHKAGIKTIQDVMEKQIVFGASGPYGSVANGAVLMNKLLGTKFKIVTGYAGGQAVALALERGEVDSIGTSWGSFNSLNPAWISEGRIIPLVQVSLTHQRGLEQVPLLVELAKTEQDREIFYLYSADASIARPYAAPPKLPKDRLEALRTAFMNMTKDQEFLDMAKRQNMLIDPTHGADVQKIVETILSTSLPVKERMKEFLVKE